MKTAVMLLMALLGSQSPQMPKNNPDGIWESASGTQYELRLQGTDLSVRLVPGTSARFTSYEVDLKNSKDETNTYAGRGAFAAKMKEGKECRFETEWQLTVVSTERIIGVTSNIVPDPDTCAVQEKNTVQLDLKKKK